MSATQGTKAQGTLLKRGDSASPEAFTAIAEIKDLTGPQLDTQFADFTHQESPGGYREEKPTFKTAGDMSFKCNFLPDDSTQGFATSGLIKDYDDQTKRNYQVAFPDTGDTKCTFPAYVKGIGPTAPIAGALELNVTLHIVGQVVWS